MELALPWPSNVAKWFHRTREHIQLCGPHSTTRERNQGWSHTFCKSAWTSRYRFLSVFACSSWLLEFQLFVNGEGMIVGKFEEREKKDVGVCHRIFLFLQKATEKKIDFFCEFFYLLEMTVKDPIHRCLLQKGVRGGVVDIRAVIFFHHGDDCVNRKCNFPFWKKSMYNVATSTSSLMFSCVSSHFHLQFGTKVGLVQNSYSTWTREPSSLFHMYVFLIVPKFVRRVGVNWWDQRKTTLNFEFYSVTLCHQACRVNHDTVRGNSVFFLLVNGNWHIANPLTLKVMWSNSVKPTRSKTLHAMMWD